MDCLYVLGVGVACGAVVLFLKVLFLECKNRLATLSTAFLMMALGLAIMGHSSATSAAQAEAKAPAATVALAGLDGVTKELGWMKVVPNTRVENSEMGVVEERVAMEISASSTTYLSKSLPVCYPNPGRLVPLWRMSGKQMEYYIIRRAREGSVGNGYCYTYFVKMVPQKLLESAIRDLSDQEKAEKAEEAARAMIYDPVNHPKPIDPVNGSLDDK